jgi:CubicO group peptidase (beta-lactamase class C family)
VLQHGRVLCEYYENGLAPATPHLAQSVSKSIVGALAGVLHAEGLFDLAQPIDEIVPELAGTGYAGCTMDQALDMLSGVRFTEDYGVPWSDMTRIDVASGWRPELSGGIRPTIRDVILTLPREAPHGTRFGYRSIETDVVAWALERLGKMPLAGLLSDRIWRHLGCERDGFFTVDSAGTALADGGFNATLRDFARFGQMLGDGGRVGEKQVVPRRWIDDIAGRRHRPSFGAPYTDLSPRGDYRRFFWVHDGDQQQYMARGVFGQMMFFDQQAGVVIVKLSSWPDYLVPNFSGDALRACLAICAALADRAMPDEG